MLHLLEGLVHFLIAWPGSPVPDATEGRTLSVGCLLIGLVIVGLVAGIYCLT